MTRLPALLRCPHRDGLAPAGAFWTASIYSFSTLLGETLALNMLSVQKYLFVFRKCAPGTSGCIGGINPYIVVAEVTGKDAAVVRALLEVDGNFYPWPPDCFFQI